VISNRVPQWVQQVLFMPMLCYNRKDMSFWFQIIFRPEPEGGYTVLVPSLPGCVTYGETLEEAERMAQDAIEGCVAVMKEEGEDIVDDSGTFEKRIQVAVA
jgi:antitoxin HicB